MSAAARARAPALLAGLRRLGTSATEAETRERGARWELSAAREYYDYRKSIYGDVTHRALLVDAVGTLVVPAQPTAQVSPAPAGRSLPLLTNADPVNCCVRRQPVRCRATP
jgi:hypothetical protein